MSGLFLNEDDSNFFMSFPEKSMTREGLKMFIRGYMRGQVKAIVLNPNAQRASYESHVIEPIWSGVEKDEDGRPSFRGKTLGPNFQSWTTNARLLHERGLNPYCVWLEVIREAGLEGWISCRMNDLHDVDDENSVMHDAFWREHPEYRRAPYMGDWNARALDYGYSAVRDYRMALIEEYLKLFDCDGIELDWLRFPVCLKPGYEIEDAEAVTDIVRRTHKLAVAKGDERHHKIKIGVRVPSRPDDARRLGYDVLAWSKEGLIDSVTVSNFWPTTDSDMPVEIWRGLLRDDIELNAGLDINIGAYPGASMIPCTAAMTAGFAAEYLHRGVNRMYLFNYMNGLTGMSNPQEFAEVLEKCGEKESVYEMPRRHVVTYTTPRPVGVPMDNALPRKIGGGWQAFRVNVGGGTSCRTGYVVIGLKDPLADGQSLSLKVNGVDCFEMDCCQNLEFPPHIAATVIREIPVRELHDGDNVVEIRLDNGEAIAVWCEIYLP
ncbi:MAG: hypothetical protein J6X49_12620 [Victivallales bacterium]|nr:hypothetical protein [Victivallales bacterium]